MNLGFNGALGDLQSSELPLLLVIVVWSLLWKGLALWHSAQRGEYWWFCALLVFNTLGLLEMLYLFVFARMTIRDFFSSRA